MSEQFTGTEIDPETNEVSIEPAIDFDWDELDRRMNAGDQSAIMDAREAGAQEMLSTMVKVCAEGVTRVTKIHKRASNVGFRFLCAAAIFRPGQATEFSSKRLAELLGVSVRRIDAIKKSVRDICKR